MGWGDLYEATSSPFPTGSPPPLQSDFLGKGTVWWATGSVPQPLPGVRAVTDYMGMSGHGLFQ